jgi:hypothetical protein
MFYEDALRALDVAQVDYVLVGGTAVILHGVPRTTADLDLVIDLSKENVSRLIAALSGIGFVARSPVSAWQLADADRRAEWIRDKGLVAFSFHRPHRPLDAIDVLLAPTVAYEDLRARCETLSTDGLPIRIASIPDLIALKRVANRQQDLSDIDALERLQEQSHG